MEESTRAYSAEQGFSNAHANRICRKDRSRGAACKMDIFETMLQRLKTYEPRQHIFISFLVYVCGGVFFIFVGYEICRDATIILKIPALVVILTAPVALFFRTQFYLRELLASILLASSCSTVMTLLIRSGDAMDADSEILTWVAIWFISIMLGSIWSWTKLQKMGDTNALERWHWLFRGWIYSMTIPLLVSIYYAIPRVRN